MSEQSERGNDTVIDLHLRIVDLLMSNFVPQSKEMDSASNLLIRRAVSSIADDIVRMAEDVYGVNQ